MRKLQPLASVTLRNGKIIEAGRGQVKTISEGFAPNYSAVLSLVSGRTVVIPAGDLAEMIPDPKPRLGNFTTSSARELAASQTTAGLKIRKWIAKQIGAEVIK